MLTHLPLRSPHWLCCTLPHACDCRFLNYEEALLHGDRAALLGLLEDLHRFADGQPSAGTCLREGPEANSMPYLPYGLISGEC